MSSTTDPTARLAAALERISHASLRPAAAPAPDPAVAEVAAGLDSLIARVRAALGPEAAAQE